VFKRAAVSGEWAAGHGGGKMADTRLQKMARVLVHYSLDVKKGMWIRIGGEVEATPLLTEVYVEALKAGGYPMVRPNLPRLAYLTMKHANEEQLRFVPPTALLECEKLDAMLTVLGESNTKEMSNVDPNRMTLSRTASRPVFEKILTRIASGSLRWCSTQFPTPSAAQDAEMSQNEYEDFVYGAGFLDRKDPVAEWKKLSIRQAGMVKYLNTLKTIRIIGIDTDLSFDVRGRKWINCDGHENFPDGEVFTGPVENTASGHIRFSFPSLHGGKEVENVRLVFEKGKVAEAGAGKGEEYLHSVLDTDAGARYVGELSFGTNYGIKRFTRNTLFDEKIGGTMHIAMGASLPESGGKNKSAVHWDMVCDTRKGFVVYGDGKPVLKNGKWVA
jgi:aminopeptidase